MPRGDDIKPKYIPEAHAAARYHVVPRSLKRWDLQPALEFPPCIMIRGRRYREVAALDAWDKKNSLKAAETTHKRRRPCHELQWKQTGTGFKAETE